ncbi:MAG: hypothetical protein ABI193_08575, partial [Minicystis sp.]
MGRADLLRLAVALPPEDLARLADTLGFVKKAEARALGVDGGTQADVSGDHEVAHQRAPAAPSVPVEPMRLWRLEGMVFLDEDPPREPPRGGVAAPSSTAFKRVTPEDL